MAERSEYQVCQVPAAHVTFINGTWMGHVPPSADNYQAALGSGPSVWDYLRDAGRGGWELVAAHQRQTDGDLVEKLYLKRGY